MKDGYLLIISSPFSSILREANFLITGLENTHKRLDVRRLSMLLWSIIRGSAVEGCVNPHRVRHFLREQGYKMWLHCPHGALPSDRSCRSCCEPVFLQIGVLLTLYRTAHFVAIGHLSLVWTLMVVLSMLPPALVITACIWYVFSY